MDNRLLRINFKIVLASNNINFLSHDNINEINDSYFITKEVDNNNNRTKSGLVSVELSKKYNIEDVIENDIGYELALYMSKKYGAFILQTGNMDIAFAYEYKTRDNISWLDREDRKKDNSYSYALLDTDLNIVDVSKLSD